MGNTTANASTTASEEPATPITVLSAVILGNLIAIALLIYNRKDHKWSIFYRLLMILVLIDFAGQGITSSVIVAVDQSDDFSLTEEICILMTISIITTSLINILLVCMMSVDRVVVAIPNKDYSQKYKIRIMYLAVCIVFVICLIIGVLMGIQDSGKLTDDGEGCSADFHPGKNLDFLYLCAVIGIMAIIALSAMNLLIVGWVCYLYYKQRRAEDQTLTPNSALDRTAIINVVLLIIITVAFMFRWIPFIGMSLYTMYESSVDENEKTQEGGIKRTSWHQVLQPYVYVIMRYLTASLFKKCRMKFCSRCCKKALNEIIEQQEETGGVEMMTDA